MNTWQILRGKLTENQRPLTAGHAAALNRAADVFVAIQGNLADREVATTAFNADTELREALLIRGRLKEIGL